MAKFVLNFHKQDNSFPLMKISLRKWIADFFSPLNVLDVYGANGEMYRQIWKLKTNSYHFATGESLKWLNEQKKFIENVFDIDPYASPYEAISIIGEKAINSKIGMVCTDGTLRRVGLMRTKIPKFLQEKCNWPERNMSLLAGIYHKYPSYLRYVLNCVAPQWRIEKLAIKYGLGTWRQSTVYFAGILNKKEIL